VIAWFRYELERTGQKINLLHIQKAARGAVGMIAPFMFFLADDEKLAHEKVVQHRYMVIGYIAVWTIYIGYLLFLFTKLRRLEHEADAVGLRGN
jgi:CcmD family protein